MAQALPQHPEPLPDGPRHLPHALAWAAPETAEDAAAASGAVLGIVHAAIANPVVPLALLRARLALSAAATCAAFGGRPEREAALRDVICLLRPGDLPGPAGEIALAWHRVVTRPLSAESLQNALPGLPPDVLAAWQTRTKGNPVRQAAQMMEAAFTAWPRNDLAALVLADAALARALGWDVPVPLLATGLHRRDLKARGDELRLACHKAVVGSARTVLPLVAELARRAAHLRAVAPKLRARGAAKAVSLFLTRDALAPAMLAGPMSDRAARRLCDRLVDLGAVRELTGRDSFRLYGV
jgi:hypothetical protein